MDTTKLKKFQSFANTELWTSLRDDLVKELAKDFRDVSKPFKYGDTQLEGADAYYAKVGASKALDELISIINRLKKSKTKVVEDFE